MNELKDARTRNLYYGLIGALVVAGAIVVGCANSADASERHHPQPRPAVKQNVTANPSAKSSSGGNEFTNKTDGDSNIGVMYAAPSFSSSFGGAIGDGTATTGRSLGFPLIGGGVSEQDTKPTYGLLLSDEMRRMFTWAFYTDLDDPNTRAMWAIDLGHNVSAYDVEMGKADQGFVRAAFCADDFLSEVVEKQNIECP